MPSAALVAHDVIRDVIRDIIRDVIRDARYGHGHGPQVVPALKALSGLLKNHSPALLGGDGGAPQTAASAAPSAEPQPGGGAGAGGTAGGDAAAAVVIAQGVFDELHLPALSQSIRQVCLCVCVFFLLFLTLASRAIRLTIENTSAFSGQSVCV